jgi:predicted DsbA family dithiol-disulfide isomerase
MLLNIDLVSDFVCPWCLVGKTRLHLALQQVRTSRPDLDVRLNWLPFFLNPDTPAAGEPYREFIEGKCGGRRQADNMLASVAEAGAEDGVAFAFDRIRTRPNTLKAHRLSYRAQALGHRQEKVGALADALFAAHFQEGRDIGNSSVLAEIAAATTGDSKDEVLAYLESGEDAATVKRMAAQLQKQGVTAVPFFIFNRELVASGAQSPAVLGAAMLQAIA